MMVVMVIIIAMAVTDIFDGGVGDCDTVVGDVHAHQHTQFLEYDQIVINLPVMRLNHLYQNCLENLRLLVLGVKKVIYIKKDHDNMSPVINEYSVALCMYGNSFLIACHCHYTRSSLFMSHW